MNRVLRVCLMFALVVLIGLSSCNNASIDAGSTLNNVPEDASFLVSINPQQLMDKADFEAVKEMEFYQAMIDELKEGDEQELINILNNPAESGIDLARDASLFFAPDGDNMNEMTGGLIFGIADVGKLESIVSKSKDPIQSSGDFKYMETKGGEGVIAWTDNIGFAGRVDGEDVETKIGDILSGNNNIAANSSVQKALGGKHDISYWMTSSNIAAMLYDEFGFQLSALSLKRSDLMDNTVAGYTDFEAGKISTKGKYDLSSGLLKDIKLIAKDEVKTNFRSYISTKDLGMVFSGALNMKGINQLMKDKGADGFFNKQAEQYDVTTDDVADAIDGDMFVATYNVEGEREPDFLMGMKLGDKKQFDKLMDLMVGLNGASKTGKDSYKVDAPNKDVMIQIQDNIMFVSTNDGILEQALSGVPSDEQVDKSLMSQIGDGIFGMFMDFNSLSKMTGDDTPFASEMDYMTSSSNWDGSSAVMVMKDKDQNSLKLIMKAINEGYKQQEEWRKKFEKKEDTEL